MVWPIYCYNACTRARVDQRIVPIPTSDSTEGPRACARRLAAAACSCGAHADDKWVCHAVICGTENTDCKIPSIYRFIKVHYSLRRQ